VLNVMMINSPGGPRKPDDSDHPLKEVRRGGSGRQAAAAAAVGQGNTSHAFAQLLLQLLGSTAQLQPGKPVDAPLLPAPLLLITMNHARGPHHVLLRACLLACCCGGSCVSRWCCARCQCSVLPSALHLLQWTWPQC
jgi:hypothetical protein